MTACRLDRGCGEDPCVCQPPAKSYPRTVMSEIERATALSQLRRAVRTLRFHGYRPADIQRLVKEAVDELAKEYTPL